MPKKYRLTRADFARMRSFKRLHGELFSLSCGSIPGRSAPGFACVVPARVVARASARNMIKRRCRAVFQRIVDERWPLVYVYYAKKAAQSAAFSEIEHDVSALYARARSLA